MRKPRSLRRKAGMVVLTTAGVCAAAALALSWSLRARPARGEEPPPGYSSNGAIKLAILTGQLPLIDPDLPIPATVKVTRGVEYGRAGDVSLKLDLYAPKGLDRPTAGLILIHGGGWKSGNRGDYRYYGVKFAQQGYVAASIDYRLRDVALFPASVEDAKCAVRWMRASAAKLHVDPQRIAVAGGSAGGHLAMMVGYSSDVPALEGGGGHQQTSSRVQAVVDFYGPVDLTTPYARTHDLVTGYLGKPFAEAPEVYRRASPMTYITDDDPPTLILHGTIDDLVPIRQADALAAALEKAGVPHRYQRLEGWPHGMDLARVVNDYCFQRMLAFLEHELGPPWRPSSQAGDQSVSDPSPGRPEGPPSTSSKSR